MLILFKYTLIYIINAIGMYVFLTTKKCLSLLFSFLTNFKAPFLCLLVPTFNLSDFR